MEEESAYHITITRVDGNRPVYEIGIREAIEAALRRHHTKHAVLSVALVGDERMAHLNQKHLDHDGPTDVLAFDLRDQIDQTAEDGSSREFHQESTTPTLDLLEGEIVLSTDTAAREAQLRGHSLDAELAFYAVHGTLHLLGYSDHDRREAARMYAMEDDILSSIGIGPMARSETES